MSAVDLTSKMREGSVASFSGHAYSTFINSMDLSGDDKIDDSPMPNSILFLNKIQLIENDHGFSWSGKTEAEVRRCGGKTEAEVVMKEMARRC